MYQRGAFFGGEEYSGSVYLGCQQHGNLSSVESWEIFQFAAWCGASFLHSCVYSWYTSLASPLMSLMGVSAIIVGTAIAKVSLYLYLPFFLSGSKHLYISPGNLYPPATCDLPVLPVWMCWTCPFVITSFRINVLVQPLSLATMIVSPVSDVIWNVSSIPLPGGVISTWFVL